LKDWLPKKFKMLFVMTRERCGWSNYSKQGERRVQKGRISDTLRKEGIRFFSDEC
jgi:hypothetical protein